MSRKRRDNRRAAQDKAPPVASAPASAREWNWGDRYDRYQAVLFGDVIIWIWTGPKDLGGSGEQPVLEFLAFGPLDTDAPADVLEGLRDAIQARDPAGWPKVLAAAEALREGRAQEIADKKNLSEEAERAAVARFRETQAWPDPWRKYVDKSGSRVASQDASAATDVSALPAPAMALDPLLPLLAQGLLIFVISTAAALLLGTVLPILANYISLLLPVLLGFVAAFRWGSLSLIIAGFFAMAGGIGSQLSYERYWELSRGTTGTLRSIEASPNHPEVTRFIVDDVRGVHALSGNIQRVVTRSFGAGPRDVTWVLHVMPLVQTGWTRDRPVPAWLACTTTPGFDCLMRSDGAVGRTVRVRDYDLGFYRKAIVNAEGRHRLTSAAGAPVLEVAADPVGAPELYLAGTVMVPLAVYGLWAIILIGWRAWRRVNKSTPALT